MSQFDKLSDSPEHKLFEKCWFESIQVKNMFRTFGFLSWIVFTQLGIAFKFSGSQT